MNSLERILDIKEVRKNNLKNARAILNVKETLTSDQCIVMSEFFKALSADKISVKDNIAIDYLLGSGAFQTTLPY
jgi:hypothetical protein